MVAIWINNQETISKEVASCKKQMFNKDKLKVFLDSVRNLATKQSIILEI